MRPAGLSEGDDMTPFLAFFNLGPIGLPELLVIFALVLFVFGPRKLPEIAEAFGKSINRFNSATRSPSDEVNKELDDVKRSMDDDESDDSSSDHNSGS